MKRYATSLKIKLAMAFLLSSAIVVSCGKEENKFQPEEPQVLVIPEGFPPMSFPEDNAFTMARWRLGKKLFYDPILSIDGTVSCASCHKSEHAFADNKAFSPGVENRPGVRNAPTLTNVGYQPYYLSEGGVPTLEMQVLVPIQEHNEFAHDVLDIAKNLNEIEEYVRMSQEAYSRHPDPFVITRALATFERSLISGNSPYDQYYYQGKKDALIDEAKKGMDLFFSDKANCSSCHSGFNFTDYSFKNNGLETTYKDKGRMRLTGRPEDESLFKVPTLRNVALTAPYMHNGKFETLMEVVEHYNAGGQPHPNKSDEVRALGLSKAEQQQLVAFLQSLTDENFISRKDFQPEF